MKGRAARWLAEHWIDVGSPVVLLLAWEWASATGLLREAFFPRPSTVFRHLGRLAADGTLGQHTGITLARIAWAFGVAAVLGVAFGLAMGLWRRLREGLDPVFAVVYPIPSILFLPLLSFVVRSSEPALVLTSAVTSFFLVAYTTMTGVHQVDRSIVEAATHYGARGAALFAKVLLPAAAPSILTGLRLGLGYTLIVVIATEMVSAPSGLGSFLWLSWQVLKVEDMYVALAAIAALGALSNWALAALRARVLPWARDAAEAA
jgi:ABC-type nitrate/sulfonate/bicarbonate transport system permease component